MAKPQPITIPTEPIGSIPTLVDLIERVSRGESEDPNLVPLYEEVRDRVLEASEYVAIERLGTTDDSGFSPFSDETSTIRKTAFARIRAPVLGTKPAESYRR
jgi:hypothetical protein